MDRPYIYYDFTLSLCSQCLRRVDAKVVFENDKVWMLKRCPTHGAEKVLIADDVDYYRTTRNYAKRSEMPRRFNAKTHFGSFHYFFRHIFMYNLPEYIFFLSISVFVVRW